MHIYAEVNKNEWKIVILKEKFIMNRRYNGGEMKAQRKKRTHRKWTDGEKWYRI